MRDSFYAAALLALGSTLAFNSRFIRHYVNVEIDKGIVRGLNTTTWRGSEFYSFKGIPYAKPPIGDLRFKAPEEEAPWAGVLDATSHGSVCPHLDIAFGLFLRGKEDCLFLNVYTPTLWDRRLPVMVYIHGGSYTEGSGNDDLLGPDYFMRYGVVLVTINYRLGALGFLSTGDEASPGNAGLKDQVAALRWVKRNVAKFGGDPDNVTIFGESAGGASISFHILSPMSKGLFSKAISQSGTALNVRSLARNVTEATVRLAEGLGARFINGSMERALDFLKTAPYGDIVRMQGTLRTAEEKRIRIASLFLPTIERGVKSEEVFLPDDPLNLFESGRFNKVPHITGHTSHEGYLFWKELTRPEFMKAAIEDTERFVPRDITDQGLREYLGKSIREFYFDGRPVGGENISSLVDLYTDCSYVAPIKRTTQLQLQSSDTPIYFYVFSYDGGLNLLKHLFNIRLPGAAHTDDLGYLFSRRLIFWRIPSVGSDDDFMVNTMLRLWTNFAKYGDPTPAGDPLSWKPVTKDKFNYLNISGRDTKLGENPDPERADFWDKAYEHSSALRLQDIVPTG